MFAENIECAVVRSAVIVLPGAAAPAAGGTPGMAGYGMAKVRLRS